MIKSQASPEMGVLTLPRGLVDARDVPEHVRGLAVAVESDVSEQRQIRILEVGDGGSCRHRTGAEELRVVLGVRMHFGPQAAVLTGP